MATVFTMIINGDLPGHFLWRDASCVSFLSINPTQAGHALVVPIEETDHWLDLDVATNQHLMAVGQAVGKAQQEVFQPVRVGQLIAGFEVPHVHLHIIPIQGMADLDLANAATNVDHGKLDDQAAQLRDVLRRNGHDSVSET